VDHQQDGYVQTRLWTVQEWFAAPHLHPDAWTHAQHVDLIPGDPPAGVPIWYGPGTGSRFGHVAISLGGGRIRSTDCPRDGMVGDTDLHWPQRRWGHDYRGWSTSIGGQPIPGIGEEDDMTPEQQQTLDNVAWMVGQIKPQTDQISPRLLKPVDDTNWLVANSVIELLKEISGKLDRLLEQR
jgi:hypothetical protein